MRYQVMGMAAAKTECKVHDPESCLLSSKPHRLCNFDSTLRMAIFPLYQALVDSQRKHKAC
jgi:hypothetical protein